MASFPFYDDLKQNTFLDKKVLDNLISRCILMIEDREEIIKPALQSERNRVLLDILTERPYSTFNLLKDVLDETDPHNSTVQKLQRSKTIDKTKGQTHTGCENHDIFVDAHKIKQQKNYMIFVHGVACKTDITDKLYASGVLDSEEKEEICNLSLSTEESNRLLYDKLYRKGEDTYKLLLNAIRYAQYDDVASEMEKACLSDHDKKLWQIGMKNFKDRQERKKLIFNIGELEFIVQNALLEYNDSSSKRTEEPSRSLKCCLCCTTYEDRSPAFNLVKWTFHPPKNWDLEEILEKIQHNYSALAAVAKESTNDGSLTIEKEFLREVVEDKKIFKLKTISFYKQMIKLGEIDVETPAKISVDCTVNNIPTDQSAEDLNGEFYLKNTFQVYVEKASNDPNLNLVDIKSFKDGRIVIADKNLHQIMHFSGKGQLLRSIKLDGAPTSLDIIDNTTVCVTVPNEGIVVLDVNSGKQQKPITVEGKCCSIMYRKDYFFVGCENGTLKVLSRSEDMKQTVFPLQFEPSGICGQIADDGRIFVMFCQSTQDNRIYRVKIDVEDINQNSSRYPVHVTLDQSVGTAHFGLTIDDDDNLIFLDNKNLYKAYNEGTRTPVLSPSKEISCMHYDMLSKTMLLVTVGGEVMFYAKYNTRL